MEPRDEKRISPIRRWIATAIVILVVIAVWKFIDYRMQPPPPPNPVAPVTAP
jgi:hypothetical protein